MAVGQLCYYLVTELIVC